VGGGIDIEEVFVGFADHPLEGLAEQFADLAVGVLVTQLGVLDIDIGLDAVENGVQALFAGLQVAGFLGDLAAQDQRPAKGQQEQRAEAAQAPPDRGGDPIKLIDKFLNILLYNLEASSRSLKDRKNFIEKAELHI
jgi:hypothetical protein